MGSSTSPAQYPDSKDDRLASDGANPSQPARAARSFLFTFLVTLALLVLILFGAATATDPSRHFFGSPVPQIWTNTPRVKVDLLRQYIKNGNVTGLILGSSRSAQLLPAQADRITGLRFFNASVFYASTLHYLALYRLFRQLQPPPKVMILGIEPDIVSSSLNLSEDLIANYPLMKQLDPSLSWPWHMTKLYAHYFRVQTLSDLGTSLKNWRHPRPPFNIYFPDGHVEGRFTTPPLEDGRLRQVVKDALQTYGAFTAVSDEYLGRLQTLFEEASADHVPMLVWLTPMHPALSEAIQSFPNVLAAQKQARRRMLDMAARFHATVIDLSDPQSFGGVASTMVDAFHVSTADAQREIPRILAGFPAQN